MLHSTDPNFAGRVKCKVYIRVDGDNRIGLGHIYRCLSLAHYIESIAEITFIVRNSEINFNRIFENRFSVVLIDPNTDFASEWKTIEAEIITSQDSIIVLDGYHFGTSYQLLVKESGLKLIVIDGIYQNPQHADIVVNYNLYADASRYEHYGSRILTGSRYALVRAEFLRAAKIRNNWNSFNGKRILLTFGGTDQYNITLKVLSDLVSAMEPYNIQKVTVLLGQGYKYGKDLYDYIESASDRISVFQDLNAEDLVNVFEDSNLAICPGSTTLYEIFCVGLPLITGYYVENQILNADYIQKLNLGVNLGDFNTYSREDLFLKLEEATERGEEFYFNQKGLIDSRQKERFVSLISNV